MRSSHQAWPLLGSETRSGGSPRIDGDDHRWHALDALEAPGAVRLISIPAHSLDVCESILNGGNYSTLSLWGLEAVRFVWDECDAELDSDGSRTEGRVLSLGDHSERWRTDSTCECTLRLDAATVVHRGISTAACDTMVNLQEGLEDMVYMGLSNARDTVFVVAPSDLAPARLKPLAENQNPLRTTEHISATLGVGARPRTVIIFLPRGPDPWCRDRARPSDSSSAARSSQGQDKATWAHLRAVLAAYLSTIAQRFISASATEVTVRRSSSMPMVFWATLARGMLPRPVLKPSRSGPSWLQAGVPCPHQIAACTRTGLDAPTTYASRPATLTSQPMTFWPRCPLSPWSSSQAEMTGSWPSTHTRLRSSGFPATLRPTPRPCHRHCTRTNSRYDLYMARAPACKLCHVMCYPRRRVPENWLNPPLTSQGSLFERLNSCRPEK